jgi:lysophospholipase L1-like esterase/uncharacterized protein YjdB
MQKIIAVVCYLLLMACFPIQTEAQDFNWVKRAGDNNNVNNYGTGVAIDHNHNTVVTGVYSSGCVYGLTTLTGPGSHNIFLSKYDSSGNLKWVHTIGGNNIDEAAGVAVDNTGNIYVAGNMHSPAIYFDAFDSLLNTNANGWNGFVAKYDSSGNFLWAQGIKGPSDNKVETVTTDASGNVIIGGYFTNAAFFQGTQLRGGLQNIFIAKYTATGLLQWATAGKSNNNCFAKALITDAAGNIYTTGKVSGNIAFNTSTLGTIYDQVFNTTFVPGNFYSYLSSATLNFTPSGLLASGGNGSIYNFLYYLYYSNLENLKLEANLRVTASGAGVGLTKNCGAALYANFPLVAGSSNQVNLLNAYGASTLSAFYSISVGDSVNISLQRNYDTVSATLINYTKHYTVTTGYRYLIGLPVTNTIMPNNGFYDMYFLGGSQTIYEYKLSSTENKNALCAITGNSITTGYYSGGYGHRYSDVLYNSSPYFYDVNAGAGDLTYHVLIDTLEMLSLNPKYVLINIGVNDAFGGVDTNVYQTEYSQIVGSYKRNGIIPVADLLVPLGGTRVDPYNRRIKAVAAANGLTVVDITTALADPVTGYMQPAYNSGDNVHPSGGGNLKMAQTIAAQAPFVLTDTTAWNAAHMGFSLPPGNDRVFTGKFNSSGAVQWIQIDTSATAIGSSPLNNYSCGNAIALDNAGNIYTGGSLLDAILPVVAQDAFIEKYTNSGSRVWEKRWGNNAYDAVQGLAVNAKGYPYAVGNYGGNMTIGGTALATSDLSDIFFAKFDTSGNPAWVTNTQGHGNFSGGIAVDAVDSTLAMTGSFNNSATFGSLGIASPIAPSFTNYDIFVAKHSGINPTPLPITGTTVMCASATTTLSDPTPAGIWSSSNTVIATIGTGSGIVSGILAGTSVITYKLANGYFATTTITINPLPAAITGAPGLCTGTSATLSDASAGGIWSSGNSLLATIGSASGIVSAINAGTDTFTYILTTGCKTIFPATVNPLPLAISGVTVLCANSAATLSDATTGGAWSSGNTGAATISPGPGIVSGIAAGTTTITYTLGTGCFATANVTVNALPSLVTGVTTLCAGTATTLSDATTGGIWSSPGYSAIISIGSVSGIVSGIAPGTAAVTYTLTTGCLATTSVTVNPLPLAIAGVTNICTGLTASLSDATSFGIWASSNTAAATIGAGTGLVSGITPGTTTITYLLATGCIITASLAVSPTPLGITGITTLCTGSTVSLSDAPPGGIWSSGNTSVATVAPGTGVVSGIAAGIAAITYKSAAGCMATTNITVNPLPSPITGVTVICNNTTTALSDVTGFGTWLSSNTAIAGINSGMGVATGITAGTATITYALPTGCSITTSLTVEPLPSAISGIANICTGASTSFTDGTPFGIWSSSNSSIAAVGSGTGFVFGVSAGVTNINYALATGCMATMPVTINPSPLPVTGSTGLCLGATSSLADGTPYGIWSSGNTAVAFIGPGSGIVSAVSSGIAPVTYKLSTGCQSTASVSVNPLPLTISGVPAICTGNTAVFSDATPFGVWSSSNSSIAAIGSGSGIVTGSTNGVATITYSLASGCTATTSLTVNTTPLPPAGTTTICAGSTTSLTDGSPFGLWSGSGTSIATIGSATGILSGVSAGVTAITYQVANGCYATTIATVNPLPATISGAGAVCNGAVTTLSDVTGFGAWSSSNTGIATAGVGSGIVSGLMPGTSIIAYTLATGCKTSMSFIVDPLPAPYAMTGGGSYCAGGAGMHVGLASSDTSASYQLYIGGAPSGPSLAGTGVALDFGLKTAAGTYSALATNNVTLCTSNMASTVSVIMNPVVIPSVSMNNNTGDTICAGMLTTFTATATNGGTLPIYQWNVNGANKGTGTNVYSYTPANGDAVVIVMTSNAACAKPISAVSATGMTVDSPYLPSVIITADPSATIVRGQSVTFLATATDAGPEPMYQWSINGTIIPGANSLVFTSNTLSGNDTVSCMVTGSGICGQHSASQVIILLNTTGIAQTTTDAGNITVLPNPNKGYFTVKGTLGSSLDQEVVFELTDMLGQVVYKSKTIVPGGLLNAQVQLSNTLANGMYLLTVVSGSDHKLFHIVLEQ